MREQAIELNNHLPEIFAPDGTVSGLNCEATDFV
jgi:hypothetical protein